MCYSSYYFDEADEITMKKCWHGELIFTVQKLYFRIYFIHFLSHETCKDRFANFSVSPNQIFLNMKHANLSHIYH